MASSPPLAQTACKATVKTVRNVGKGFVAQPWLQPASESPVGHISDVQGFKPLGLDRVTLQELVEVAGRMSRRLERI